MSSPFAPYANTPVLDLNAVKALFSQGLEYAKANFSSPFYSVDNTLCDFQNNLVQSGQDIDSVMNGIWMPNITFANAFTTPKPICTGCEIQHTNVQFGIGNLGWYFIYGVCGELIFNFSLFRLEMAPSYVVNQNNIDPSEAVRWKICGGFGTTGANAVWYTVQPEWIYMKYTTNSVTTFSMTGAGNNIGATFESPTPMNFAFTLAYNDTNKVLHNLKITMSANAPPSANAQNSCMCTNGVGSMYYSYTDMNCTIVADSVALQTGKGWIDHQLVKSGLYDSVYVQAVSTVVNTFVKNVSKGWLWFAIQDYQSDVQYMFLHFFGTKFYQDDIALNANIPMNLINVYQQGVTSFMPKTSDMDSSRTKVRLVETVYVPSVGLNLPSKYNIVLPSGKSVVLALAGGVNVYPTVQAPYENPSILYDTNGNQIGIGLIEANGYFTNDVLATRWLTQLNLENTPENLSILQKAITPVQTTWQKVYAFIIAFLPVLFIILSIIFIVYKKDKRMHRFCFVGVLVLVAVFFTSATKNKW